MVDISTPTNSLPNEQPLVDDTSDRIVVTARKGIFQYPLNNIEKHNLWVLFQELSWKEVYETEESSNELREIYPSNVDTESDSVSLLGLKFPNRRNGSKTLRRHLENRDGAAVALYCPGSIEVSDGASYSPVDLEGIGYMMMKKLRGDYIAGQTPDSVSMNKLIDAAGAGADELRKVAVDLTLGVAENRLPISTITKVLQATRFAGNNQITGGLQSALKHVANPHTHSIFQNVGLRKFTFTFEFFPEDIEEAYEVRRIIEFFRRNLYPEKGTMSEFQADGYGQSRVTHPIGAFRTGTSDSTPQEAPKDELALRFPTMLDAKIGFIDPATGSFKTELDDGSGPVSFRMKPLYIESVNVVFDHNSTMAIHRSGHFLSAKLTVTLGEETTLTKEDIVKGGF